jgi:AhpD family alkylhydroperoxidase
MNAKASSLQAKREMLQTNMASLFKAAPQPLRAFHSLSVLASAEGVLPSRVKELMVLSIAIVTECEGCIIHHIAAAQKHGASREEVLKTIAVAISMGGGPATVYGAAALAAFDEMPAS